MTDYKLNQEQITNYNENGFLMVPEFFRGRNAADVGNCSCRS